jgi:hypothetical protein
MWFMQQYNETQNEKMKRKMKRKFQAKRNDTNKDIVQFVDYMKSLEIRFSVLKKELQSR